MARWSSKPQMAQAAHACRDLSMISVASSTIACAMRPPLPLYVDGDGDYAHEFWAEDEAGMEDNARCEYMCEDCLQAGLLFRTSPLGTSGRASHHCGNQGWKLLCRTIALHSDAKNCGKYQPLMVTLPVHAFHQIWIYHCQIQLSALLCCIWMVSAEGSQPLLLRSDGRAVAIGRSVEGQCNIPTLDEGLTYTHISSRCFHSVLLRSDRTQREGQCDIPLPEVGMGYIDLHWRYGMWQRFGATIQAYGRGRWSHAGLFDFSWGRMLSFDHMGRWFGLGDAQKSAARIHWPQLLKWCKVTQIVSEPQPSRTRILTFIAKI